MRCQNVHVNKRKHCVCLRIRNRRQCLRTCFDRNAVNVLLQMSSNGREAIEGGASDDDITFERQRRSSLKVHLSYDSSLSDSGKGISRKAQIKDNQSSNALSMHEESSVIICCAVEPNVKFNRASTCIHSPGNEKNIRFRNADTNAESMLYQQKETKDGKSAGGNRIEERNMSVEFLGTNNAKCQLVSESDEFMSCKNSESDTPQKVRSNRSSSLSLSKLSLSSGRSFKYDKEHQDVKNQDNSNLDLTRKKNKYLSSPLSSFTNECTVITGTNNENAGQDWSLIGENQDIATCRPVMCSTFIEGKANSLIKKIPISAERTGHIKKSKSIGKAALNEKLIAKVNNQTLREKQKLLNSDDMSVEYIKSTTINVSVPMDLTKIQNEGQVNNKYESNIATKKNINLQDCRVHLVRIKEDSMKTIRSSLNVNTSLDPIDRDSGLTSIKENSVSIQDTSMQVNTSLDNVHRTLQAHNSKLAASFEQDKLDDQNVTKRYSPPRIRNSTLLTTSLAHKRGNISIKRKGDVTSKSDVTPEKGQCNPQRLIDDTESSNKSKDSPSFVEGTPYPVSRSVLLKSYLKCNTLISNTNSGMSIRSLDSAARNLTETLSKTGEPNFVKDQTTFPPMHASAVQMPVSSVRAKQDRPDGVLGNDILITEEQSKMSDQSDNDDPCGKINNNISASKADVPVKSKKKLFSCKENSQLLSLTPVDSIPMSPKKPRARRKRRKQKLTNMSKSNAAAKGTGPTSDCDKSMLSTQFCGTNELNTFQPLKKEPRKPRRILSKKFVINKRPGEYMLRQLNGYGTQESEMEFSRRVSSLDEFESRKTIPLHMHKCKSQDMYIVTTGLSKGDKDLVRKTVKTLGGAKVELRVTYKTTHVVSAGGRTINLLHGIIRGCWLVKLEWVVDSSRSNKWLNPIKYEMKEFSKAVSENRKDRQMFGPFYVSDLFTTCGFVYIENNTTPSRELLKELINAAGGQITEDSKKARIVIGKAGLKESWILDSITTGELQSFSKYQRA